MLRITVALALAMAPPDDARTFEIVAAPAPQPVVEPEPIPEPAPAPPVMVPPPPELVEVDPVNYRIVLAGDVLVGLGGVGFVSMCAGLVVYYDASLQRIGQAVAGEPDLDAIAEQDRRVALGTNLAIVGGVSAAVLMGAGIGLIIGGRARERKRRDALAIDPTLGGLALRF